MKNAILLSAGFCATLLTHAQTDVSFARADLQTVAKVQKALRLEEKYLKEEKKADKAVLHKAASGGVSFFTKQNFYHDFGDVPVQGYQREGNFEVVLFTGADGPMKAFYDTDYNLVGTVAEKKLSDLPDKALSTLADKYAGYEKGQVIFFDDNETNDTDMLLFGKQFEDADNYFVEVTKDGERLILEVSMNGDVEPFQKL